MAQTGKKINELTAITTVSDETVLPAVYVSGGNPSSTANKVSIEQISNKITNDLGTILNSKQDKLTAGDNITIESNVISATDTKYTAGTNITISEQNVISADVDALPSQTGQSGKFLTTDGTDASWAAIDSLPSQTGQSGKFLTTDGTDASWAEVNVPNNIWTQDNLVAGENISITQVENPTIIDEHTIGVWHLDTNTFENAVTDSSAIDNISTVYSLDTANFKFGPASARICSGSSAVNIVTNLGISANSDTTLDFWYYTISGNSYSTLALNGDAFGFKFMNGIVLTGNQTSILDEISKNTWHHFAFVRKDNVCYYFIDGRKQSYTQENSSSISTLVHLSPSGNNELYDELRISNVARWTSDFTPYTEPYSLVGATQYQINNTKADPDLSSYLQNTATMNTSLTVAGVATTSDRNTNIGKSSAAYGAYCTVIGNNAKSGVAGNECDNSTLVGANTSATGGGHNVVIGYAAQTKCPTWGRGIAIGDFAIVSADYAVQIGTGFNSTEDTFQVFSTTVVDANGKIPMSSTDVTSLTGYDATKTQVLKNVNGTLTWVDEA